MEAGGDLEQRIASIAALDQPLRRDLYRLLSQRDGWVTRDEASEALEIPRSVVAFHLDKLVDAGVVEITLRAHQGPHPPRGGPTRQALSARRR
jgi:predicted ArsR family transcriptional regulator